jgi:hypothetical protein
MELKVQPKLPRWVFVVLYPFTNLLARYCIKQAENLATVGVWFQGAVAVVAQDVDRAIDDDGTLVPAMESFEIALLQARRNVLDMIGSLEKVGKSSDGSTRDALRLFSTASADAFEAVQAFRWAVMEHDAEIDIALGHVSEDFTSVEDLIASLKS